MRIEQQHILHEADGFTHDVDEDRCWRYDAGNRSWIGAPV